ncbi:MAG: dinitrogenase iron-molybdenum cofactor N-terminal domain-containing protein [Thiobacillus sp.]
MTTITQGAALRIALAARVLEGVDTKAFTQWVVKKLGLPVNESKLAGLTVTDLKQALTAEETQETAIETDVDMESLKLAVRYLWGEDVDTDDDLPAVEAYAEGDMPGSLRVAVASNKDENLDGHFGSALRFLIYQLSKDEIRLVAVRPTLEADLAEDKNAARSALINDCQVVYVQSVGGPAAAKIVRAGVHPMKYPQTGPAREVIARLQSILDAPPPWLAKILGVEAKSLTKFAEEEEELDA